MTRGQPSARSTIRVGFLLDRWDPRRGGAEGAMARLARHLAGRGYDVHAFGLVRAAGAPGDFHAVQAPGLTRARREQRLAGALVDAAREARCDVTVGMRHLAEVDLYWPHGGSHAETVIARRRARGLSREPAFLGRHRVFLDLERALLDEGGARRVVCVSELVREELKRRHPACGERTVVVPNGVDLEAFHPRNRARHREPLRAELGVPGDAPLVAFAGRDPLLKGLPQLFEALAGLVRRPWTLCVAGPRHARRWEHLARRHGLEPERVIVREDVETAPLLAAADLFVHPTWRDTSGLAILESLASGTPVVTTRCAGAAEAIASSEAGSVLPDPVDVDALRRAVGEWLSALRAGRVDREAARACVADRGEGPWLAELEDQVVSLVGSPDTET